MTAAKMLEQKQFYYILQFSIGDIFCFLNKFHKVCFCSVLLDVPIFVSQPQTSSLLLKSFIITKRKSENGLLIYTFSNKKKKKHPLTHFQPHLSDDLVWWTNTGADLITEVSGSSCLEDYGYRGSKLINLWFTF